MSFWDAQAGYDIRDLKHPDHRSRFVSSGRVSTLTRTTGSGAPTASRIRVLEQIAAHYRDLVDPLNGPASVRGDGDSIIQMPPTYTPTVREFERLTKQLRDSHMAPLVRLENGDKASPRQLWWHLNEWHLKAETVIVWKPVKASQRKGRRRLNLIDNEGNLVKRPERGWRRHPQAKEHYALEALRWMAANWKLTTEPMLPDPLKDAA